MKFLYHNRSIRNLLRNSLLVVLFSCVPAVFVQAETPVGQKATIQLPAGWITGSAEGVEFVASNPSDTMSIVFLREVGNEIEVSSIDEYYEAKIINFGATLTEFKAGEKKSGEINGLKAVFTEATSEMDDGGKKVDGKMYLMMFDAGNGEYYMGMTATSPRLFDANAKMFMGMLRSFKVK